MSLTPDKCPIREHVPDVTGMCRVCGEECFAPCPAEIEVETITRWLIFPCRLYAGHEEDHDYGAAHSEAKTYVNPRTSPGWDRPHP